MSKHVESAAGADSTPCNCLALRQAARHISQLYDQHLVEVGLRTTQYSILSKLGRLGAMPISKLAATMVMERTALSRAIGPLERDGLVEVGAGPDGRTRRVELTPTGQARLKVAAVQWRRAQKEFEIAVGAADAADLRNVLQHVISVTSGAAVRRSPRLRSHMPLPKGA
jgi:DNA-binding MarR family transcriptional regulator